MEKKKKQKKQKFKRLFRVSGEEVQHEVENDYKEGGSFNREFDDDNKASTLGLPLHPSFL